MQSLANQLNAFIVCLTETHLSNEVFDANIHINGFTPFRCDRSNRKGGGVMIYVKDNLTDVVEIFNKSNGTCECIVLHLKSINLVTSVFYRPPSSIEHGGTRPFFYMGDQYFGNDSLEPFECILVAPLALFILWRYPQRGSQT